MIKNKLIYYEVIIISSIFIVVSFTSVEKAEIKNQPRLNLTTEDTSNKILKNLWEPVIGRFKIVVLPDDVINIEIECYHFNTSNWTFPCQNVLITWEVINIYSTNGVVTVGYRIREWQRFFPLFLFFFSDTGNVYTPNDTKWLNPHTITIEPYTNSSGVFNVSVCFYEFNPKNDVAVFLWGRRPLNFDWSGIMVKFS